MKHGTLERLAGTDMAWYDRETQLRRLRAAMPEVLTEQQYGDLLRVVNGEMMADVARARGVNKSTVSRNVRRAVKNLQKALKY